MGVPCIVSDINGCNELIKQGENGLIVPAKNSRNFKGTDGVIIRKPQLFEGFKSRNP